MANGPLRLMVGTRDDNPERGMAAKLAARGFEVSVASGTGEILERVRQESFDFLVLPTTPLQADMFLLAERLQESHPRLSGRIFFLPEVPAEAEDRLVGNLADLMRMFSRLSLQPAPAGRTGNEDRPERSE